MAASEPLPWYIHDVPEPPPGPLADLQRAYGRGLLTWQAAIDDVAKRLKIADQAAEEIVSGWDDGGWSY